jgi:hypothetical protein
MVSAAADGFSISTLSVISRVSQDGSQPVSTSRRSTLPATSCSRN